MSGPQANEPLRLRLEHTIALRAAAAANLPDGFAKQSVLKEIVRLRAAMEASRMPTIVPVVQRDMAASSRSS